VEGPAFSMTFIPAASSGILRVFLGHDTRLTEGDLFENAWIKSSIPAAPDTVQLAN
jgi:hypothetical protein